MSGTVDIGAARVRLIVDANEFDGPIRQGQNAVREFGSAAEAAYDKQQKATRRAANALLDYVSQLQRMGTGASNFKSLDTAAAKMDELVRKASRAGVVDDVLKPAITAWQKYAQAVMQAEAAQENEQRTAAAAVAAAKQAQLQAQITLYNRVEQAARDAQQAEAAQAAINSRLGVGMSTGLGARDQSALIAELQRQVQLEEQIEAQARDINSEVNRWKLQLDAIGKDYYQIQIEQAKLRYGANADPIIKQIEALRQANTTIRGTTVNVKQLQQAVRFLPAQFTDIGVSLAGGMNPALVLFQQGGQILDQFRLAGVGAGGALKEIGRLALTLVNPWTLAAGAAVAFVGAATAAEARVVSLNDALIYTGNYSAKSALELAGLAARLDDIEGVTEGSATKVIASIVKTGEIAASQLNLVAEAALRANASGLKSADETVNAFREIAKSPVDALVKLNQAENFLTETQYNRIKALQEEGRNQDAVSEAIKIYFNVISTRSVQAEQNITSMGDAWRSLKRIVLETGDSIVGAVAALFEAYGAVERRSTTMLQNQRKELENELYSIGRKQGVGYRWREQEIQKELDAIDRVISARSRQQETTTKFDAQAAEDAKKRAMDVANYLATADEAAQRKITITRLREEGKRLGQSQAAINAVVARQEALWKAQDAKRGSRGRRDGPDPTRSIKAWQQAELEALKGVQRETKWAYDDHALTVEAYYTKLNEFAKQERDIAVDSAQKQIAALAGRKDATERIEALQENIRQAETAYANKKAENDRAEVLAVRERERALQDYIKALDDANKQSQREADLEVARLGMGDKRYQRMVAINDALRKRQELEEEIARKEANFELSVTEAERYREALGRINDQINIMVDGFSRLDDAQANWQNGAQRAWENWLDQVHNTADKAEQFMTTAFNGMGDVIVDTLYGSTDSWRDYFDNLAKMITKFIAEQKLTQWMQSLQAGGGSSGGGFMGFVGNLFGALLGGGGASNTMSYAPGGSFTWNPAVRPYAKGGVPSLSEYRNKIVATPTTFRAYAAGGVPNMGVMGERYKPEAIVPLARTSSGDLGVRVAGGSQQTRAPAVTVQQTFVVNGTPDRMTRGQLLRAAGAETSRAVRRG